MEHRCTLRVFHHPHLLDKELVDKREELLGRLVSHAEGRLVAASPPARVTGRASLARKGRVACITLSRPHV
eukprot:scaffold192135_cov23-Tisochrysis_lutea.AAC.1